MFGRKESVSAAASSQSHQGMSTIGFFDLATMRHQANETGRWRVFYGSWLSTAFDFGDSPLLVGTRGYFLSQNSCEKQVFYLEYCDRVTAIIRYSESAILQFCCRW